MKYSISIDQKQYEVEVGAISGGTAQVSVNGIPFEVHVEKQAGKTVDAHVARPAPRLAPGPAPRSAPGPVAVPAKTPAQEAVSGAGRIAAPIPGLVLEITVGIGDAVKAGQVVVIMEAMKMENRLITNVDGQVKEIRVHKGAHVATGDVIMIIG